MKMDVVPGRTNTFEFTPTKEGKFVGRCAELCGAYHSRMLFDVQVVSAERYADYLQELEDKGQTGLVTGGADADTQVGRRGRSPGRRDELGGEPVTATAERRQDRRHGRTPSASRSPGS